MKYKEKQKLWLSKIKQSKSDSWKFKDGFIFKNSDEFFYSATFYVSLKENIISGYLGFKPMNIDDVFWDIIDEQPNKKMPLSFRAEAAFCVRKINFYEYNIEIEDVLNPEKEINDLLIEIDNKVSQKASEVKNISDFRLEIISVH